MIYFFIFLERYINLILLFMVILKLCYLLFKFWYKYIDFFFKIKNYYRWILNRPIQST